MADHKEIFKEEMIASYLKVLIQLYMQHNAGEIAKKTISDIEARGDISGDSVNVNIKLSLSGKSRDFISSIVFEKEDLEKLHKEMNERFSETFGG
jgi:hypothetical protein